MNRTLIKSRLRKALFAVTLCLCAGLPTVSASAYIAMVPGNNPTPKLHVTGRYLQDPNGRNVTLHGWYQPAQSYFNGGGSNYPDPTDYSSPANVAPALNFLNAEADVLAHQYPLYGANHGWYSSFVRLNGSPGSYAPGYDPVTAKLTNPVQFYGWLRNFVVPYINHCRQDGLYVVILGIPAETFQSSDPDHVNNMSREYQRNLMQFWAIVASTPGIRGADNVQFEICNEPINIETSFFNNQWGNGDDVHYSALLRFMEPIVETIRSQNSDNIIWIPGLGYQSQYSGFVSHPIIGGNVGYAAHFYPGYVGGDPNETSRVNTLWNNNYKPCADRYPMMITEMWWEYYTSDQLRQTPYWNLFSGITGDSGYGFGAAIRNAIDAEGNVSYLVGFADNLISNIDHGLAGAGRSRTEGASAAFDWFPIYGANGSAPSTPTAAVGPEEGYYSISPSDNPNLFLEGYTNSSANGTRIWQQYSAVGGMLFYFHPLGNNSYWLEPGNAPGKALEINGLNPNVGASLDISDYHAKLNQIWLVINLHNGSYSLAPDLNPTQTIDQPGGSVIPCALQTYTWFGQANQQWTLHELPWIRWAPR